MMTSKKQLLLSKIAQVEQIASMSKWQKLFHFPFKYILAQCYRIIGFPLLKKDKKISTKLFFNKQAIVSLPACTDIYLTSGKSHDSEIRLATYFIHTIKEDEHFIDIGAHIGYFSMLVAELNPTGKIISIEPAINSYNILKKNVRLNTTIIPLNMVVSAHNEAITFYEFPASHAEYNTLDISQYEAMPWFKTIDIHKVQIESITLDNIVASYTINPTVIKIDVEGGEYQVLLGATDVLRINDVTIIIEYIEPKRKNTEHQKAAALLYKNNFQSYSIDKKGHLHVVTNIDEYLSKNHLDSDNIVFKKNKIVHA